MTVLQQMPSVVVRNESDRPLEVRRVTFTLLGPESDAGLRTDPSLTQGLKPRSGEDGSDAVYDYVGDPDDAAPVSVPAGSSRRFEFHLSSNGCRQAGATTTWERSPFFTAAIGTATRDLPLGGADFGVIGAWNGTSPCS